MIYLDSSVALSAIFSERRSPPATFWTEALVSSRLLEYEMINRIHTRGINPAAIAASRKMLSDISIFELTPAILARALKPFPVPVRTLDGLHLATLVFLRDNGLPVRLASYDHRLAGAAGAMGFDLAAM